MNRKTRNRLRQELFDADPHCRYCGKELDGLHKAHLDHSMPRRAGGPDVPENLVLTCYACGWRKGGWTPEQVLLWAQRIVAVAQGCQ